MHPPYPTPFLSPPLTQVPDVNMLDFLPDLLEGLFQMVTDPNKEIKMAAEVSDV